MSNYAMITDVGLNKITEASQHGELIEIAYYVPVYDYRIDPDILPNGGYDPDDISTVTSVSDTSPVGEVLWRRSDLPSSYRVLPIEESGIPIVGRDGATIDGSGVVSNYHQDSYTTINGVSAVGGVSAVAQYFVGSAWDSSTHTLTNGIACEVLDDSNLTPSAPTPDMLYTGVTYASVLSDDNVTKAANFRITVTPEAGSIKFNKLGLYAVYRSGSEAVPTGTPFLFGQVIIPQTQEIAFDSGTSVPVSDILVDFQIKSTQVAADFDSFIYASSADYWMRISNQSDGSVGLLYDGDVYVSTNLAVDDRNGVIISSGDTGVAKLFVSTFETINNADPTRETEMPQLCLQYVTEADGEISSKRIRTLFRTNEDGDCIVNFTGACQVGSYNYSLIPADTTFGLGNESNRWNSVYLNNGLNIVRDNEDVLVKGYFKIFGDDSTDGTAYTETNRDIVVAHPYSFVKANLMAKLREDLFIRSSVNDVETPDVNTNVFIIGGSWFASQDSKTVEAKYGDDNMSIINGILASYQGDSVYTSSPIFDIMSNNSGGVYITGNGYVYLMGSPVVMENMIPGADGAITCGHYDIEGVPMAWKAVYTHALSNAGRGISLFDNLIPSTDLTYSLGSETQRYSWLYTHYLRSSFIYAMGVTARTGFGTGKIESERGIFDTLTVTDLIVQGSANFYVATTIDGDFYVTDAGDNISYPVFDITDSYGSFLTTSMSGTLPWGYKVYKNLVDGSLKIDINMSEDTKFSVAMNNYEFDIPTNQIIFILSLSTLMLDVCNININAALANNYYGGLADPIINTNSVYYNGKGPNGGPYPQVELLYVNDSTNWNSIIIKTNEQVRFDQNDGPTYYRQSRDVVMSFVLPRSIISNYDEIIV